jgi:hypothetical protein
MAVVRTVLPRKGLVHPQHGGGCERDLDNNMLFIGVYLMGSLCRQCHRG